MVSLISINSKYIHTGAAADSLQAYAYSQGLLFDSMEFTINQTFDYILGSIMKSKSRVYAFSVYIWNCELVYKLTSAISKIDPGIRLWLGGPEVSYDAEACLNNHPEIELIMRGEGETVFANLLRALKNNDDVRKLQGISYRDLNGRIINNPAPGLMNPDDLVFPYFNREIDYNKIYYESSRGCPFNCAYCLSSAEKSVRFKSIEKVKNELQFFIDKKVPQVKFVDRTFNADKKHAMAIWQFIKDKDNGITNFHFEIEGDLFSEEEIKLLNSLRPGQVQLEIGVQTTNPKTLQAINRTVTFEKLSDSVRKLLKPQNIHIHLDLITGLPFEDLESFKKSFDDVYNLRPLQLQLGFLKVLKGTEICRLAEEYGIEYEATAPYETLKTDWLSYDDILELKSVEEMVEVYYNSHQFDKTLDRIMTFYETPYEFYKELGEFYQRHGYDRMQHARMKRYDILREFLETGVTADRDFTAELLYDAYARERLKSWPAWAKGYELKTEFDYSKKNPLTGNAEEIKNV